MPRPTIVWNVDANGDWATRADWKPTRLPNSTDDVAIDTAHLHRVTHATGSDTVHTLTVGNDSFAVLGGSLTIRAAASFAQLLAVSGGRLAFGGAATAARLAQSGGTVAGAGDLTVSGSATFASTLLHTGPGATLLQGASTLDDGAIFYLDDDRVLKNQGAFTLSGAGQVFLGFNPFGATLGGGTLRNDEGGTIDFRGGASVVGFGAVSFVNAGTLKNRAGASLVGVKFIDSGAIVIAGGTLSFGGVGDSFAGKISGGGTLAFFDGTQALDSGSNLKVAKWSIGGGVTTVEENLAYGGVFSLAAGATLAVVTGDKLNLAGAASLAGTVNGAGTIKLASAAVGDLTIGGAVTVSDAGTVDQAGDVTLGGPGPNAATLFVGEGATWGIRDDSDIARGASHRSRINNNGLLIKSGGTAISRIRVDVLDSGAIEAASGTLAFTRAISGGGAMAVDRRATLKVGASASANLDMTFNAAHATLALGDPARFAATIHAFNPTDTIDLVGIKATAARLGAGDTLVITNGAKTVATLQLAGKHRNDVFAVGSDGKGGTNITVTGPGPAHRLIAAMAGFGAAGAPGYLALEAHDARPAMLAGPRVAMA